MKARVKPIMKEPYMPKVREIDGTKHQMSREEYRRYLKSTPQKRAEMFTKVGRGSAKVKSIMENFKVAMEEHATYKKQKFDRDDIVDPCRFEEEEHKEIARKNGKPILSGVPMEEEEEE